MYRAQKRIVRLKNMYRYQRYLLVRVDALNFILSCIIDSFAKKRDMCQTADKKGTDNQKKSFDYVGASDSRQFPVTECDSHA